VPIYRPPATGAHLRALGGGESVLCQAPVQIGKMVEPAGVEPASQIAYSRRLRACPPDDAQPGPEARPAVGVRHILTHVSRPPRPRRLDVRDYPGRDAPAQRAQAPLEADGEVRRRAVPHERRAGWHFRWFPGVLRGSESLGAQS